MSKLTPYDTGERAVPRVWLGPTAGLTRTRDNRDDFGKVDFDDDEDSTIATLWIERGPDGSYTLKGYANEHLKVEITNGG